MSSWLIPGNINSISEILASWVKEIYPQLKPYDNLIKSTPAFQEIIAEIKTENTGNKLGFISIPEKYHSRKEIIDTFVNEIQQKLVELDTAHKK